MQTMLVHRVLHQYLTPLSIKFTHFKSTDLGFANTYANHRTRATTKIYIKICKNRSVKPNQYEEQMLLHVGTDQK